VPRPAQSLLGILQEGGKQLFDLEPWFVRVVQSPEARDIDQGELADNFLCCLVVEGRFAVEDEVSRACRSVLFSDAILVGIGSILRLVERPVTLENGMPLVVQDHRAVFVEDGGRVAQKPTAALAKLLFFLIEEGAGDFHGDERGWLWMGPKTSFSGSVVARKRSK